MTIITSEIVADKLRKYLQHDISLSELVDWAEMTMVEGEFEDENISVLRDIVGRLGLTDVKEFGLTWEDCERFLMDLGYSVQVEVIAH